MTITIKKTLSIANCNYFQGKLPFFLQHKGEMEKEWLVVDGERPVEKAVVYGGRG